MENIVVFTTGGTIDKIYGSGQGVRDMHIGPPVARSILDNMCLEKAANFTFVELMRKDSLDMNDEDRHRIASACHASSANTIIITHGTDTMVKTAEAIFNMMVRFRATVVLVGALRPACIHGTDAQFNFGLAVSACFFYPRGIYIAMNGVYPWNACVKNSKTGIFEPS